eukprot:6513811-Heterocapsa_arctica.AAC.1
MSRVQKIDIMKWMEHNPDRKADAMMPFDKALMNDKGKTLPPSLEALSGRIYDAAIGNNVARDRGWKPLEKVGNQWIGWYPWGVMKKHLLDPM